MTSEGDKLRAALAECGLFQAAEAEALAKEIDRTASKQCDGEAGGESCVSAGGERGSIREALDKVFTPRAAEVDFSRGGPTQQKAGPQASRPTNAFDYQFRNIIEQARSLGAEIVTFDADGERVRARCRAGTERVDAGSVDREWFESVLARGRERRRADGAKIIEFESGAGRAALPLSALEIAAGARRRHVITIIGAQEFASFESLGIDPSDAARVRDLISGTRATPIFLSSPSESGSRAFLAAAAFECARSGRSVLSYIDFSADAGNDNILDAGAGFSLAGALAHDPDVVLIPELESAQSAREMLLLAARGIVVLAGVAARTPRDAGAVCNILRIRRESAPSAGVIYQCSARRLCPACRADDPDAARDWPAELQHLLAAASPGPAAYRKQVGCANCDHGFAGQTFIIDIRYGSQVFDTFEGAAAVAAARRMIDRGIAETTSGATTLAEIRRVMGGLLGEARREPVE